MGRNRRFSFKSEAGKNINGQLRDSFIKISSTVIHAFRYKAVSICRINSYNNNKGKGDL